MTLIQKTGWSVLEEQWRLTVIQKRNSFFFAEHTGQTDGFGFRRETGINGRNHYSQTRVVQAGDLNDVTETIDKAAVDRLRSGLWEGQGGNEFFLNRQRNISIVYAGISFAGQMIKKNF